MSYKVLLSPEAEKHMRGWVMSGQTKIVAKIAGLIEELKIHPQTGTGQVERLRGNLAGKWSRRIDKRHRMVYTIQDEVVTVTVVSLYGHYDEK